MAELSFFHIAQARGYPDPDWKQWLGGAPDQTFSEENLPLALVLELVAAR